MHDADKTFRARRDFLGCGSDPTQLGVPIRLTSLHEARARHASGTSHDGLQLNPLRLNPRAIRGRSGKYGGNAPRLLLPSPWTAAKTSPDTTISTQSKQCPEHIIQRLVVGGGCGGFGFGREEGTGEAEEREEQDGRSDGDE